MKTRRGFQLTAMMIAMVSLFFAASLSNVRAEDAAEKELLLRTTIFKKENGEKKAVKSDVHAVAFGHVERLYDKDLGLLVSFFWEDKDELVITVDAKTYTDMIVLEPKISLEEIIYAKEKGKEIKPAVEPGTKKSSAVSKKSLSSGIRLVAAIKHVDLTKEKEQNIIFENILTRELFMPDMIYEIHVKVIQTQKQAFYRKPSSLWWDAW